MLTTFMRIRTEAPLERCATITARSANGRSDVGGYCWSQPDVLQLRFVIVLTEAAVPPILVLSSC